ncbi:MAG: response regulator [Bdellovibrionota bacterium]
MRKILLVDDDENLLNSMAEFFEMALGVICLRFHGLHEIIARGGEALEPDVFAAILDINLGLGDPSGIDVYRWLRDRNFPGTIVFLTGHAKDHPLVKQVAQIEGVKIFEKPMGIDGIISMIEERPRDQIKAG